MIHFRHIEEQFFEFSKAPNILKAVYSETPMSSSVIVVSEPEQLPETFLYRFDIVNTVNFVHYHYQYHTMSSFGDQIKNTSTGFVIRLYEITRRYSIMSLLRLEESVSLALMAHRQDLLGSLDTQNTEPAKLAPEGSTQNKTTPTPPTHKLSTNF